MSETDATPGSPSLQELYAARAQFAYAYEHGARLTDRAMNRAQLLRTLTDLQSKIDALDAAGPRRWTPPLSREETP